jgi:formylmethanofuran dehydrogenase subunit B
MESVAEKLSIITATCAACGLLCDDIEIQKNNNKINALTRGCAKGVGFFEQPLTQVSPQINGQQVTMPQAIAYAASLLKSSQQPLFAGLGTDVAGFRGVFKLAQKTNATLQHMHSASTARNMKVLQSTGWQTTTLTEVKNRADVIVCIGSDIVAHHPRFFERFVDCDGLFIKSENRQMIIVGEHIGSQKDLSSSVKNTFIHCKQANLPEITQVLRALVAGKKLVATEVAGINLQVLQALADTLKNAKYAVLVWVAKDLDFSHAELTIQHMTETVALLNQTTRAAGLPLGGSDGDTSVNNANTWLSGLTLNDVETEHDCLVWVNSFSAEKLPPKTDKPLIILGNNNVQFAKVPAVFIPVATPGLDCNGTLFRVDSSVILPLKKIRESNLPTLSDVISEIEQLI